MVEHGLRSGTPSGVSWTQPTAIEGLRQVRALLNGGPVPPGVDPHWIQERLADCEDLFAAWERFPSTPTAYNAALVELRSKVPDHNPRLVVADLDLTVRNVDTFAAGMSPQMIALLHGSVVAGPLHGVLRGTLTAAGTHPTRHLVVAPVYVLVEVFGVGLARRATHAQSMLSWDVWRARSNPTFADGVDVELLCMLWRDGNSSIDLERLVRSARALERGERFQASS